MTAEGLKRLATTRALEQIGAFEWSATLSAQG